MTNLNENSSSPSGHEELTENIGDNAQAIAILLHNHNTMISNLFKAFAELSGDTKQRFEKLTDNIKDLKEFLGMVMSDRSLKEELKSWQEYTTKTMSSLEQKHDKTISLLEVRHEKEIERLMSTLKISGPPKYTETTPPPNNLALQQMLQFQQQQQALLQQQLYVNQLPQGYASFQAQYQAAQNAHQTHMAQPLSGARLPAPPAPATLPPATTAAVPLLAFPQVSKPVVAPSTQLQHQLPQLIKKEEPKKDIPVTTSTTEKPASIFAGSFTSGPSFVPAESQGSSLVQKPPEKSIFGLPKDVKLFDKPLVKTSEEKKEKHDEEHEGDERPEDYQPDVDYAPVIPLPELVQVKTGEENEQTLFEGRCKLFRFVPESKEFKERGVGTIKILKNPTTNDCRVVMRRDQVHKVCANFKIVSGIHPKLKERSDKALIWMCKDFSEGEITDETFVAKFKSAEETLMFKKAFDEALELASTESGKTGKNIEPKREEPPSGFGDKFKLQPGQWECQGCYVRNKPEHDVCACCGTNRDGTPGTKDIFANKPTAAVAPSSTTTFNFGLSTVSTSTVNDVVTTTVPASSLTSNSTFSVPRPVTTTTDSTGMANLSLNKTQPATNAATTTVTTPFTMPASIFGIKTCAPTPSVTIDSAPKTTFTFTPPTTKPAVTTTQSSSPVNFSFASPSPTTASTNSPFSSGFKFNVPSTAAASPASTTQNTTSVPSVTSTFGGFSPFGKTATTKTEEAAKPTFGAMPLFGTSKPTLPAESKKETTPQPSIGTTFGGGQATTLFGLKPSQADKQEDSKKDTSVTSKPESGKSSIFGGGHGIGASFASSPSSQNASFLDKSSEKSLFGAQTQSKLFDKPVKSKTGEEKKEKHDEEHDGDERPEDYQPDVDYAPVIPLPELVQVKTGEENEQALFEGRCKLFRFVPESKEFKERGVGTIKILKNPNTNDCRVVMRRDQVHKVCANFKIVRGIHPKPKDGNDKALIWMCKDFSEGEIEDGTFVAKFKSADEAQMFKKAFDQALSLAEESASSSKPSTQAQPKSEQNPNQPSRVPLSNGGRLSRSNASTSHARSHEEDEQDYEDEEDDYDEDEVEILLEEDCSLTISNGFVSPLKASNAPPPTQYDSCKIYVGIDTEIYKVWFQQTEDGPELFPNYINMHTDFNVGDRRIEYNAQDIYTGEIKRLTIQFSDNDAMARINESLQQGVQCAVEQNFEGAEE